MTTAQQTITDLLGLGVSAFSKLTGVRDHPCPSRNLVPNGD
jgi:hypothetical protein